MWLTECADKIPHEEEALTCMMEPATPSDICILHGYRNPCIYEDMGLSSSLIPFLSSFFSQSPLCLVWLELVAWRRNQL
jgi:hypothetical protein